MPGILDDWFGIESNNRYNPWLAAMAANQAQQDAANQAAAEAAAAQNAQAAAAAATATTAATPTATATPAAPTFDAAPYRGVVDAGFSQFTPEWYANQYQSAYAPYRTGVQSQYGTARDQLTAGLARRGGNTTQNQGLFQQLDALRDQELGRGQTAAQGFQDTLTGSVNNARTGLYNSIAEGADNASLGTRTSAATAPIFNTRAPASTLGSDVFGSVVSPYANTQSPAGPAMSFGAAQGGGELNLAGGATGPAASAKVVNPTSKKKKF